MNQETYRSTFVTVLAWIFIVLAGFSTFISIMQNIMLGVMLPTEEMDKAMSEPDFQENVPYVFEFLFANFHLFFLFFLVISATTFISAIGLLKRKNWARIIFIIIMSFGILWNIFGVIMNFVMFSEMPGFHEAEMPDEFKIMQNIMMVFTVLMAIGFSVLFGWIIKKLSSAKIKAEFVKEV